MAFSAFTPTLTAMMLLVYLALVFTAGVVVGVTGLAWTITEVAARVLE